MASSTVQAPMKQSAPLPRTSFFPDSGKSLQGQGSPHAWCPPTRPQGSQATINQAPGHNGRADSPRASSRAAEHTCGDRRGAHSRGPDSQGDPTVLRALPAEAELLLMIKGPLVTQAEKSSSDPRWKRDGVCGAERDTSPPPRPAVPPPPLQLGLEKRPHLPPQCLMVLISRCCSFPKAGVGDLPPVGAPQVCHFQSTFCRPLPVWTGPHTNSHLGLSPAHSVLQSSAAALPTSRP